MPACTYTAAEAGEVSRSKLSSSLEADLEVMPCLDRLHV